MGAQHHSIAFPIRILSSNGLEAVGIVALQTWIQVNCCYQMMLCVICHPSQPTDIFAIRLLVNCIIQHHQHNHKCNRAHAMLSTLSLLGSCLIPEVTPLDPHSFTLSEYYLKLCSCCVLFDLFYNSAPRA